MVKTMLKTMPTWISVFTKSRLVCARTTKIGEEGANETRHECQGCALTSLWGSCWLIRDASRAPNVTLPMASNIAAADTVIKLANENWETDKRVCSCQLPRNNNSATKARDEGRYRVVLLCVDQRQRDAQDVHDQIEV